MDRNRKAAGPRGTSAGAATVPGLAVTSSRLSNVRRSALLGTVATGLLLFGYGRTAHAGPDVCAGVGTATVTCTGDQSDGILSGVDFNAPPTTTLYVNGLTQDIAPGIGVNGIFFGSLGSVTIDADTTDGPGGPVQITTTGPGRGVYARSVNGDAIINFTGTVDSENLGLFAVTTVGGGEARITSTGDITSNDAATIFDTAISARATYGDAYVKSTGTINAGQTGIYAGTYNFLTTSFNGDVEIISTGNVTAGFVGLDARGQTAKVTSTGDIAAGDAGVFARASNGDATIVSEGDVTSAASALFARSVNGVASVTSTGDVWAAGSGIIAIGDDAANVIAMGDIAALGDGIFVGTSNSGTGRVTIGPGSTVTGGPNGAGIDFAGGRTNRVINFGSISTLGENAIESDDAADDTVDNYGTVTGNIALGAGADRFNNRSGGLFNTGTNVFLGAGDLLHNAGTVSPGGTYRILTTVLTGNMVQTGGGIFAVDLDLGAAKTDRLNVTGTAQLNGTVAVTPKNLAALTQQFVILSADGGVTNNGLALGPVSPILQAELLFPNANDVVLGIDVDFVIDGLNRNQTAIAKTLNAILEAGGGTLGSVFNGFLNVFTLNGVRNALDQLSPEIYANTEIAAFYSSFDFSDSLLSCKVNGATTASVNTEGQCLWVGAKGRDLQGDNTFEYVGFDETAVQFAGGAQFALNPVWRLGFGAGYQASTLETDSGATSNGDQLQGGVSLKYNPGALLVSGTVSGGRGWYDTMRSMAFGGFAATAQSDHEIDILQGRLNASYVMGSPAFYYKPILDAAVTDIGLDDIRERGAGGASLFVRSDSHTVFSISPALEIGTEWWWSNGTLVRPFLRGGLTWYSEDDVTVRASFSGAPAGVPSFAVTAASDDVQADVAAGVEMISAEDSNLRLFYDGHFGDRLAVHAAGFKASVKF